MKNVLLTLEDGTIWTVELEEYYEEQANMQMWERSGYMVD